MPNLAPCAAAVVPSLGRPAVSDVPSFGPLTAPQVYSMALARCAATRNPSPSHGKCRDARAESRAAGVPPALRLVGGPPW